MEAGCFDDTLLQILFCFFPLTHGHEGLQCFNNNLAIADFFQILCKMLEPCGFGGRCEYVHTTILTG